MLPKKVQKKVIKAVANRNTYEFEIEKKELLECNYSEEAINEMLITQDDRKNALNEIGIQDNTTFYEFFINYAEESFNEEADLMYALDEIYEDYKNSFWSDKYPNITDRYLQISSIEGEYSYFYDKETDAVYGVDWGEMDDFMAENLEPEWKSFYDFLEWYYSEDEN